MGIICCNPIHRLITGVYPSDPPSPPVPMFAYYATVPLSGDFVDELHAGTFGDIGIGQFDPVSFADWLQANVNAASGAGMNEGDNDYGFWIIAPSDPTGWTWNGDPITFTDTGPATINCFDTGAFVFNIGSPDPSAWNLLTASFVFGTITAQGFSPNYADAGFAAYWAAKVVQWCGVGAVGDSTVTGTTVQLRILNTYIECNAAGSLSGGDQQTDNFNSIACP